jgi:hypothetical protein
MSMNLCLQSLDRRSTVDELGLLEDCGEFSEFPLFQTPTEVTFHILSKKDKYQAYIRWARTSLGVPRKRKSWEPKFHMSCDMWNVEAYEEHKLALKTWLKENPNHHWFMI